MQRKNFENNLYNEYLDNLKEKAFKAWVKFYKLGIQNRLKKAEDYKNRYKTVNSIYIEGNHGENFSLDKSREQVAFQTQQIHQMSESINQTLEKQSLPTPVKLLNQCVIKRVFKNWVMVVNLNKQAKKERKQI